MSLRQRENLTRLNIPPNMAALQQMAINGQNPMFTPGLPTARPAVNHSSMHMQTPSQPAFNFPLPGGPPRQHGVHPSLGNFIPPNFVPQNGPPMTPMGHFPHPSLLLGPGQPIHGPAGFPNRNRRQPSIGGPPKAVLGGPARKLSPLPPASEPAPLPQMKVKKVTVKLPQETVPGEDGEPSSRPTWARVPLESVPVMYDEAIQYPELTTAELFPSDACRTALPPTLDVFLPGKSAWDKMKRKVIEEKLEKLGVEKGSGSNVPHIHAPHARAASISHPADPALLLFKLNKLQQSQTSSLTTSPIPPPHNLSPSPNSQLPEFLSRHGQSLSLAQPPMFMQTYNPFGPNATLGSDQLVAHHSPQLQVPIDIFSPQGRAHAPAGSLVPPQQRSRPTSRPDFTRGFGLDIPEEEEPEEAASPGRPEVDTSLSTEDFEEVGLRDADTPDEVEDGHRTAVRHSRHVSKLSASLSLRSVGGRRDTSRTREDDSDIEQSMGRADVSTDIEEDGVGEWTGSEDMYAGDDSDDESLGEYSNPSDEERARERRASRRRIRETEMPRRLPNFPRPPENTMAIPLHRPEDDIISNPSEEERDPKYFRRDSINDLPPLPHSRVASSHYTVYDPACAHSRAASEQFGQQGDHFARPGHVRKDSLNPLAKPFVFGRQPSGSRKALEEPPTPATAIPSGAPSMFGHERAPSFGKPLNVAAVEFKPGGFTFRPPPGGPQLSFPNPDLADPPAHSTPARAQQGREKRQRRGSSASLDDGATGANDSMASFKFPSDSPAKRRSAPSSPTLARPAAALNAAAPSFTSSKFNPSSVPFVPKGMAAFKNALAAAASTEAGDSPLEEILEDGGTRGEIAVNQGETVTSSASKPKRAPIPLDFTQALPSANKNKNKETSRKTSRSRLGSHDFGHSSRPSLDDLALPQISRNACRGKVEMEPSLPDDIFGPRHRKRRSSLPSDIHTTASSLSAPRKVVNTDLALDLDEFERRLVTVLDDRMQAVHHDLARAKEIGTNASTEALITEMVAVLQSSIHDARGDIDLELIKDAIHQGHSEARSLLQREMHDLAGQMRARSQPHDLLLSEIEQSNHRTVNAIMDVVSHLSDRVDAFRRASIASESEQNVVEDLKRELLPALASLRPVPVDYDFLTERLSQAVKPHISQLIDLASDKRETAGLIVDRIVPLLPPPSPPAAPDTSTLVAELTTEIRRILAPMDAFEIKEQVADLVVERMDSRLAVRDRGMGLEGIVGKVGEAVMKGMLPLVDVLGAIEEMKKESKEVCEKNEEILALRKDVKALLVDVSPKIDSLLQEFEEIQHQVQEISEAQASGLTEDMEELKYSVEEILTLQKNVSTQELLSGQKAILDRLSDIPQSDSASIHALEAAHAEFAIEREAAKREISELKDLNADYMVQVTKARGAHGQVRVEKDQIAQKLGMLETEQEAVRGQLEQVKELGVAKDAKISSLEDRNKELENALAQALARLQASDATARSNELNVAELEKSNQTLAAEKQELLKKADTLDLQVKFANHEKLAVEKALDTLQGQHDHLASQQEHWEDLRRASEQLESLTSLIGQADTEELRQLRQAREQSQALENEHTVLMKRFKEQETKFANMEKTSSALRQSLAQAQQRASEWERQAKEHEGVAEQLQTQLEQTEQTQSQLEADHSFVTMQLEEREAESRLTQDRENKLRVQISTLEGRVIRLQAEVEKSKAGGLPSPVTPANSTASYRKLANGYVRPAAGLRSDSRDSSAFGEAARRNATLQGTPPAQANGRRLSNASDATAGGKPSVRDSIHAPFDAKYSSSSLQASATPFTPPSLRAPTGRYPDLGPSTPKAVRRPAYPSRQSIPSPTPSTVSMAPTLGDDGWYS